MVSQTTPSSDNNPEKKEKTWTPDYKTYYRIMVIKAM